MRNVDQSFLDWRAGRAALKGFPKQKWILFCEVMLRRGFTVELHEAVTTVSKYVYVRRGNGVFKVRFSNHAPNARKEETGDCDFFVGRTNKTITTTSQAITATIAFFEVGVRAEVDRRNPVLEEL